jgi:hypothetical protein
LGEIFKGDTAVIPRFFWCHGKLEMLDMLGMSH